MTASSGLKNLDDLSKNSSDELMLAILRAAS